MNNHLEERLIECLDALEQGHSFDEIVARYPDDADELRLYLETAVSLQELTIQPTLAAQQNAKAQFLKTAAALKGNNSASTPLWLRLRRILVPIVGLAMLIVLFSAALIPASAQALPGDALYSTKRIVESARLQMANSPRDKANLAKKFNQERISEINTLMAEGRQEPTSFYGTIEEIASNSWTIAGVKANLADDIIIKGQPEIGLTAVVTGHTKDGQFFALSILIPDGENPPPAVPAPIETATVHPTQTTEPATATPTPSPTNTATATIAPTETATPDNTPTSTATETAVAPSTSAITPTPGDDYSNADGDDDNNDDDKDDEENNDDDGDDAGDEDDTDDNDNSDDDDDE